MNSDYKIERLKTEILESCNNYYKNHTRIPVYIVTNAFTLTLIQRMGGYSDNEFGTLYFQGYRIAIDSGMKDYEFKVVGD